MDGGQLDLQSLGSLLYTSMPTFSSGSGVSSPRSPTLTHASSAPEDTMDLFDFNAFEDSPLTQPPLINDSNSIFDPNNYEALYNQYFGQEKALSTLNTIDEAVINPLLLDATTPEDSTPQDSDDDNMDEDYKEEPAPKPAVKRPAPATKAASERKVLPKRKAKTAVADLALPLPPETPLNVPALHTTDKDAQGHLPHIVFPVPDYVDRPPPEEYAKLSSKEKRQLRNKISARNFRHRRKEYITTLEGEIAQRDSTISALSEEVTSLRSENKSLRTDLDLLKKTVDELLNKARPVEHQPAAVEPKFNPSKDRSSSSSSKWAAGGFAALPHVNVHTTLVPSPSFPLQAQRNMNPLMDKVKPSATFHLPHAGKEDDSFFGQNPFTLDPQSMDRYRAQLYSNLTHNLSNTKAPVPGFKPSFFAALPSTSADAEQQVREAATRQTAFVAQEAASTLARGLLSSFWKTFTGSNPHNVVDLLAGRAELRIVPSDRPTAAIEELETGLNNLSVSSTPAPVTQRKALFGRKS